MHTIWASPPKNESNRRKYQYFRKLKLVQKHRVKVHVFIKFKLLKRYNCYLQAINLCIDNCIRNYLNEYSNAIFPAQQEFLELVSIYSAAK